MTIFTILDDMRTLILAVFSFPLQFLFGLILAPRFTIGGFGGDE